MKRLIALLLAFSSHARGHDYWLLPDAFSGPAPREVKLGLELGMGFVAESPKPFLKARTVSFAALHGDARRDWLPSLAEEAPQALVKLDRPGIHVLALERSAAQIELDGPKFREYLIEEGLHAVLAERERSGESSQPARERYRRYLKTRLDLGKASGAEPRAGHRFEITLSREGKQGRAQLWFDGQPLPQAELMAYRRSGSGKPQELSLRTDVRGQTPAFDLSAGVWLLRAVHMQRAAAKDPEADWESFWTAYTFSIP